MKLLLWDIDGTLVCTDRAGEKALVLAMKEVFDIDASLEPIDFRGRTDAHIGRMLFDYHGLEFSHERLHDYLESYLKHLALELKKFPGKTHPGIVSILEKARQRSDIAQGLLTGNLKRGAQLKLEKFDVWNYFEFGAFADDSHLRNDLGPHAVRRARDHHQFDFTGDRVFVIGDTPHDIACGKVIGARTIAVATGAFSIEDLKKHEPTAVLPDLSDEDAFFRIIDQT